MLLAAVALAALTGAAAVAQNAAPAANGADKTTMTPAPMANPNAQNPPANAPRAPAAQEVPKNGPNFVKVENSEMLSSNVVGLDIYNDQNNNVGKIHDIAMDPEQKVTAYILSVGGFLGMGTHYVAVDPQSLNIKYDQTNKTWRATMNATKDQLKAAPEFKYGGQWTASRS
jgi:hypothetical protein